MVTTVGTESNVLDLLEDLIKLDYDAIAAYEAAISRLDGKTFIAEMTAFRDDHVRHTQNLGALLGPMGRTPPTEGDAKAMLTKGKVLLADLLGDKAILQAMKTNEDDTNTAYERAVKHADVDMTTRQVLERNRADEARHRSWIEQTLATL